MRRALALLMILGLTGCPYMSKSQFDEYWDGDGDQYGPDEDCDNNNPYVYPYAHDFRGDGCDADCGAEPDADNDDWPDSIDCDSTSAEIYPCAPEAAEDDGVDSDCDGLDTTRTDGCSFYDPDALDAGEPTPLMTRDCVFTSLEGGSIENDSGQ
ncbi:MAG: hypothetical protein EP330_27235 [Deltaproteobacteria bacterium]|nr:MAG: hypothetical protein EP330_27235 [Deltaproteobacteria bacterium]